MNDEVIESVIKAANSIMNWRGCVLSRNADSVILTRYMLGARSTSKLVFSYSLSLINNLSCKRWYHLSEKELVQPWKEVDWLEVDEKWIEKYCSMIIDRIDDEHRRSFGNSTIPK